MMACFKKISNDALKNVHRRDMYNTFNFPWSVALATCYISTGSAVRNNGMAAQGTWDCTFRAVK
jgi:hypothetical protein